MAARDGARVEARDPVRLGLLGGALLCLLLVGLVHPSVAAPPLGPPGWVPTLPEPPVHGWGVVALQAAGYLLGGAALVRAIRVPSRLGLGWPVWLLVGAATLLTVPYGTADHTNYAAYGHILVSGGDPWLVSPESFGPGPIIDLVQPPWREAPSVYGPVATGIMGLAAQVGGDVMRQVVWVWQVVVVLAWLLTRWLLLRIAPRREVVDTWWTGNALVLGAGVLGAHVDLLAAAAVVAVLVVAARVPGVAGAALAGALTGVAVGTKVTAGVVALTLVLSWARQCLPRSRELTPRAALGRAAALVAGMLVVAVPMHLWAGPHVFAQVSKQSGGVSYASPWRAVYTVLDLVLPESVARLVASAGSALLCVVLAVALWRLLVHKPLPGGHRGTYPVPATSGERFVHTTLLLVVLTGAYALGAAYVLPWYELPMWAAIAAWLGLSPDLLRDKGSRVVPLVLTLLVVRGTVLALGYVPGRITLPGDVEVVTLAWRMVAVPAVTLVCWVVLLRRARQPESP